MPSKKVQELMYLLQKALDEEEQKGKLLARLEWFRDNGTASSGLVITWIRNFGRPTGQLYEYAAIYTYVEHLREGRWYTTERAGNVYTTDDLIEKHLIPALEDGFQIHTPDSWKVAAK